MAAEQWKEFFYCSSIPADLLMVRGERMDSENSANKGDPEVITDGSVIAVADGQCAIVVSGGRVTDVFSQTGENVFMSGKSASVFAGSPLSAFGKELGRRISFAGDAPPTIQRVYYMNTKEIPGNAFGDETGIPFRIYDENTGLDIDLSLVVSGLYSFRICDPAKIYKQLIGNVKQEYSTAFLTAHMKTEVNTVIRNAIAMTVESPIRSSLLGNLIPAIIVKTVEAANKKLGELRGIEITSLAFEQFTLTGADMELIRNLQFNAALKDVTLAAAHLTAAQAEAMISAASHK